MATIGCSPISETRAPLTAPTTAPASSATASAGDEPVSEVEGEKGGGQRHGRADGQVDALGADDQGHAQGDDDDGGDLDQLGAEIVGGHEVLGEQAVEDQQHGHGRVHAVLLVPGGVPQPRERTGG